MVQKSSFVVQAPVVRKVGDAVHRINRYPVDSVVCFVNIYPLDSVIQPLNNRGQKFISIDLRGVRLRVMRKFPWIVDTSARQMNSEKPYGATLTDRKM